VRSPYGDFWSTTVPIAGTAPSAPGSAWGTPGRYVYRYTIVNPNVGTLDWIIDPFAREFGVGKLSAFTLGYQAYQWSAAEAQWRVPPLSDLILYEVTFRSAISASTNVSASARISSNSSILRTSTASP
jgi:1,4-alpha-glucan branching enzyme